MSKLSFRTTMPLSGRFNITCRGRQLPTQLCFIEFVCKNERIGTLRGGGVPGVSPWIRQCHFCLEIIKATFHAMRVSNSKNILSSNQFYGKNKHSLCAIKRSFKIKLVHSKLIKLVHSCM